MSTVSSTAKYPRDPSDTHLVMDEKDVLFDHRMRAVVLSLNRPRKLNSLNVSMIDKLLQFYLTESKSADVNLVVQRSVIPKAFCAGGDVVALARFNNAGHPENSIRLFESEYSLNYFLGKFKKPVVSLMDGITMGGGVGLSIHTPFRVVTETTQLTMPEMAIGFFPDVGASFFFPRLDGYLGWYICLTGDILHGYDNMLAGTGTHYVPSAKLLQLTDALVELSGQYSDFDVKGVSGHYHEWFIKVNSKIEEFTEEAPQNYKFKYTAEELKVIHDMFHETRTIEGVFDYLKKLAETTGNKFAQETLDKFHAKSLLAIKIGYEILKYSAAHTNYESISEELNLAKNMNINSDKMDLGEGIYKKLILKTNDPQWTFKNIHDIPYDYLAQHAFAKILEFGQIYKFANNYALFGDSKEYVLDYFGLPKERQIERYQKAHRKATADDVVRYLRTHFPQYGDKKGLAAKVGFVLENQRALGKGQLPKL